MTKTKVDFITDLLASKKIDLANKERFLSLAALELRKIESSETDIKIRLEELETRLNKHIEEGSIVTNNYSESPTPRTLHTPLEEGSIVTNNYSEPPTPRTPHTPQTTAKHLTLFKNGNKLKWITHIYPNSDIEIFNYDNITKEAISEFDSIAIELPKKIQGIISRFLRPNKKKPNEKTITYLGKQYETWWSPLVVEWCRNHPGRHPDSDENISNTIITPFKNSIEIRNGDHLITTFKYKLKNTFEDIDLEIDYSGIKSGTRFFTGVDQLMTGLVNLFSPIIKRKSISKKVKFSSYLEEMDDEHYATVIEIVHVNSNNENDYNKESIINGDLESAKSFFTSLCDWQIIANYKNGTFIFNPLSISGDNIPLETKEKVEGFTHKLIFY